MLSPRCNPNALMADRWQAKLSRPIIMARDGKGPGEEKSPGPSEWLFDYRVNQPRLNYSEMAFLA
jgi:hypothetical protein